MDNITYGSSDLRRQPYATLPSGLEVESARIHVPVSIDLGAADSPNTTSLGSRLQGWKSRGMTKVDELRSAAVTRTNAIRSNVSRKVASVQPRIRGGAERVQSDLRTNPTKWAGIATGAGLALGLTGRYLRHRAKMRHHMPSIVVIEATC